MIVVVGALRACGRLWRGLWAKVMGKTVAVGGLAKRVRGRVLLDKTRWKVGSPAMGTL